MTYLEAVNSVLTRLREDPVATVNSNNYSKLIGEYVNDAKNMVEDAWDWSALRTTITATTSADVFNYVLTGSDNRMTILDVINDTSNIAMGYKPAKWFNQMYLNRSPITGTPTFYSFNGIDANGDTQVDVYPIPNGVYELRFNGVLRTDRMTDDTDSFTIPWLPVVSYATALAAAERGENAGLNSSELFALAKRYLSDSIVYDTAKHTEELVFEVN